MKGANLEPKGQHSPEENGGGERVVEDLYKNIIILFLKEKGIVLLHIMAPNINLRSTTES